MFCKQRCLIRTLSRIQGNHDAGIVPIKLFKAVDIFCRLSGSRHARVVLDLGGARSPYAVEIFQYGRDMRSCRLGSEEKSKALSVFNSLGASLPLMWRHGMGGVAYQYAAPFDISW